jgi:glycosyltransferase 2 family protein
MTQNRRISVIIGLSVSALAIVGILYFVDLSEVWQNLQKLSWEVVLIAVSIYILGMVVRALRWFLIIAIREKISFYTVFKGLVYGYMLNQLLPAKIGEVGRAEYLTRNSKPGRSFLLGTIAAERVFDMVIILLFLGISVVFSETIMSKMQAQWISVALIVSGIILLIFILRNVHLIKMLTRFLPVKFNEFVDHVLDSLGESFNIFKSFGSIFKILLLTLLIWLFTCLVFYLIIQDLDIEVPFYAYFFIVSAGTFGMIIPSTSANVGVYHAVAMGALMLFMVPKAQALSFAILAHAFDFFPALIMGGGIMGFEQIKKMAKH